MEKDKSTTNQEINEDSLATKQFLARIESSPQEYADKKRNLIQSVLDQETITPEYAKLLENISTTTSGETIYSELRKVQCTLELVDYLKTKEIGDKNTVYVGSGVDWQFPVALGARKICMADYVLDHEEDIEKLLKSIGNLSDSVMYNKDESQISFYINLGKGDELVELNLHKDCATEIQSDDPIDLVIEHYGPTAPFQGTSPVFPEIAAQTRVGTIIANFDHHQSMDNDEENKGGLRRIFGKNMNIYEVRDVKKLCQFSEKAREKKRKWAENIPHADSFLTKRDRLTKEDSTETGRRGKATFFVNGKELIDEP